MTPCNRVYVIVPLVSLLHSFSRGVRPFYIREYSALKMEAVDSSESLVNFYHITRRHVPECSKFRSHHCDNLKCYKLVFSAGNDASTVACVGISQVTFTFEEYVSRRVLKTFYRGLYREVLARGSNLTGARHLFRMA
jgi:hypothetical protein